MSEPVIGWQELPLGELVIECNDRVGRAARPTVLSSTKHHGLVPSDEYFKGRIVYSDNLSSYKRVEKNWFAYATNHLPEGSIGLQGEFDLACVSPIYTVFRCRDAVHPRFLYRVLKSPLLMHQYSLHEQASVDRRGAVRFRDFARIRARIPKSLAQQQRIAEILDAVDQQIDASVALTAKYSEVRIVAVRAAMKEGIRCFDGKEAFELYSGLQQRVDSWSLTSLESVLLGIDAGHSPNLEDTPAGPGQWGVLKVSAVGSDGFRATENKVVHDHSLCNDAICVRPGDLIMTRANTSELVGRSCIVVETPPGLMLCDKTLRLLVNEQSVPIKYVHIALALAEVRRQIEIFATGTSGSMKNISQQSIRQLMIPLGSPEDVQRVVKVDTLHDAKLSALQHEIAKLRLIKQGLMDDLLTGRVRVRL